MSYFWEAFHGKTLSLKKKFRKDPINFALVKASKGKEGETVQNKSEQFSSYKNGLITI